MTDSIKSTEDFTRDCVKKALAAYREDPDLIEEHFEIENRVQFSGYRDRQLYELIQNAADALSESEFRGKVALRLERDVLYCANEGAPLSERGIKSLLKSHFATKRGAQIGRFGIGFKSLAGICNAPEVFSDSVSIRFGPTETLREIFPAPQELPILRTCEVIDSTKALEADPMLDMIRNWATTVVRIKVDSKVAARFEEEFLTFPATFLLFCGFVKQLSFQVKEIERVITASPGKGTAEVVLQDAEHESLWKVFEREVAIKDLPTEAQEDMDNRINQETIPMSWAVSTNDKQTGEGHFWAFFPTDERTTVSGIINAPWNTHSDRRQLLEGAFNHALLAEAALLISDEITELMNREDPTSFLEILPARDDKGWADKLLTQKLLSTLRKRSCIPNKETILKSPDSLSIRPKEAIQLPFQNWLVEFGDVEPDNLAHRSIENETRRYRATRLGARQLTAKEWVEGTTQGRTADNSIAAILLLDLLLEKISSWETDDLKSIPCVLASDGSWCEPKSDLIAISNADQLNDMKRNGLKLVDSKVASDPRVTKALAKRFQIKDLDNPLDRFISHLELLIKGKANNWESMWTIFRELDSSVQNRYISKFKERPHLIRARAADGSFQPLCQLLWPGEVVGPDIEGSTRSSYCDTIFHKPESDWLVELCPTRPRVSKSIRNILAAEVLYDDHLTEAREKFRTFCIQDRGKKPHADKLYWSMPDYVMPLEPIRNLTGEANARMTECLLDFVKKQPAWDMVHERRFNYPKQSYDNPLIKLIKQYGFLRTSLGIKKTAEAVSAEFEDCKELLAVANIEKLLSEKLGLSHCLSDLSEDAVNASLIEASSYEGPPKDLLILYATLAEAGYESPEKIRACSVDGYRNAPPGVVTLVDDDAEDSLNNLSAYLVCEDFEITDLLHKSWGFKTDENGQLRWEPAADKQLLGELFPSLISKPLASENWSVQPCLRLWREKRDVKDGMMRKEKEFQVEDKTIYYLDSLDDEELFEKLQETLQLKEDTEQPTAIVTSEDVASCLNTHEKLLVAIGEDELRGGIESRHLKLVGHKSSGTGLKIAKLADAIYGTNVLNQYSQALERRGLSPPKRWNGSSKAINFVKQLGFAESYAGSRDEFRLPWEDAVGPIELPPLHDFQLECHDKIVEFLQEEEPKRGLLNLPTGAGKTRVAVQSLIAGFYNEHPKGMGIWLAQNDELCEQAVESWRQAWASLGPQGRKLRINRMWGKTNNKSEPHSTDNTLVITTNLSLEKRLGKANYEWLKKARFIVIDEAHHATARSYTKILNWYGNDQWNTTVPLIGLTATPFRGQFNIEETSRLVNRFGQRRFDNSKDNPEWIYHELQEKGVLAYADHDVLEGGQLELTSEEISNKDTFKSLPASAEKKLGRDPERSRHILEHIRQQPSDYPILVFATSVEHAEDLAVQLAFEGTPAAYITGATIPSLRRQIIKDFKEGNIRVLINYGVLTTGFDAPSVRVVYITRPVYSPVLYQQMIGRGLRGPKNGGKDRCLFVNVADNIKNYGEQLAFHDFEFLWS